MKILGGQTGVFCHLLPSCMLLHVTLLHQPGRPTFCCSFFMHFFSSCVLVLALFFSKTLPSSEKRCGKTLIQSAHHAVMEQTLRELWESVWPCLCCFHGSRKRRNEEGWEEAERSGGIVRQRVGQRGLHVLRLWRRRGRRCFVFGRWWGSVAHAARWEISWQ